MHPFDAATRLERRAENLFAVQLDARFWGHRAAHGGYLAAVLLRAMTERPADPGRAARSLTVHFLSGPAQGPAEVHVEVLRSGGRLSSLSARLLQDGATTTFAVAAFGSAFEGDDFQHAAMPSAPPAEVCERRKPTKVEIDHRFEHRQCFGGPPFGGASLAVYGGWTRLEAPRELDALAITLICDGWMPALFTMLNDKREAGACPTVDLTVHFRSAFPLAGSTPSDYVLVELSTIALSDGFMDESARVWSKDGRLLAQSVQHAVRLLPKPASDPGF
jgi:acyl-CoA thioesterase